MFDRIRRVLIDPRVQRRKVIVFDAFCLAGLVEELGCVSSPPEERIAGVQAVSDAQLSYEFSTIGVVLLELDPFAPPHLDNSEAGLISQPTHSLLGLLQYLPHLPVV